MDPRFKFNSLLVVVALAMVGCGWFSGDKEEVTDDDMFPALDDVSEFSDATTTSTAQSDETASNSTNAAPEGLRLQLHVGDRFPLMKTVNQELFQPAAAGMETNTSTLELLMTITVEEVQPSRTRLRVQYQRVRYSHNIAGDIVTYDSRSASGQVPPAAVVYQGLVNNTLSFWIGRDNRIIEVVGLREFLQNCLRDVPPEQRDAMLVRLSAMQGAQGVANFVDDSIGLLPYSTGETQTTAIKVGDTWSRTTQFTGPLPMVTQTNYTLKELNELVAQIDVSGQVAPLTVTATASTAPPISLRQGHCFGSCTIDRVTGLPIHSRIERYLDMTVQLAGGDSIEQRKKIVTTIRAFPEHGTSNTVIGSRQPPSNASRQFAEVPQSIPSTPLGGTSATPPWNAASAPSPPSSNRVQQAAWEAPAQPAQAPTYPSNQFSGTTSQPGVANAPSARSGYEGVIPTQSMNRAPQ